MAGDAHSMDRYDADSSSGLLSSVTPSSVTHTYMVVIQSHHTELSARGGIQKRREAGWRRAKMFARIPRKAAVLCEALMRELLAQHPYEPRELVRGSTPYSLLLDGCRLYRCAVEAVFLTANGGDSYVLFSVDHCFPAVSCFTIQYLPNSETSHIAP